jgi:peptidoglycan/xylan/chitin deacetylase (PgdA/CDA1 family)
MRSAWSAAGSFGAMTTQTRSGLLEPVRRHAISILRSEALTQAADRRWSTALRVLTYHTVPDAAAFAAQMDFVASRYHPVGAAEVIAAIDGTALAPRSIWVTFDDGDPSVVQRGLPALVAQGIPATMFVCPGVIESGEPLWPDRVEAADVGLLRDLLPIPVESAADAIAFLKAVDDTRRRALVERIPIAPTVEPVQLRVDGLRRWLDAGMDVGNHSWDHPLLDRCSPDAQTDQVDRSDCWIRDHIPGWVPLFAYPNGNAAPVVAAALAERRYALAVLHDHRLTRSLSDRYAISRHHAEATDGVDRLRSVASGVQPWAAHVGGTFTRSAGG